MMALPEQARLILLGDKEQLASVEPGAVFGGMCGPLDSPVFSKSFRDQLQRLSGSVMSSGAEEEQMSGMRDTIVLLRKSYRFGAQSGIRALSQAVNAGEGAEALRLLTSGQFNDIRWCDLPAAGSLEKALEPVVSAYYAAYLQSETAEEAFACFGQFRILCALRKGHYGVEAINRYCESVLNRLGLIRLRSPWYRGRPVMITRNDYQRRLFNGDVGLLLPEPSGEAQPAPRAFFPAEEGGFRSVLPMRLPEHETVFAMTVHKSQGSEFDHVMLILPDLHFDILTRELIYTAITRARKQVTIWGEREIFIQAVKQRIKRHSGLDDALWGRKDD
jgi:exodeoxyribonuclease V alpha subunit